MLCLFKILLSLSDVAAMDGTATLLRCVSVSSLSGLHFFVGLRKARLIQPDIFRDFLMWFFSFPSFIKGTVHFGSCADCVADSNGCQMHWPLCVSAYFLYALMLRFHSRNLMI